MRMKRIAAIAIISLMAASANAEELRGQDAVDLLGKADILFSRTAIAKLGSGLTFTLSEQKIVELVVLRKGIVWLCDIWVEGGPSVHIVGLQSALSRLTSESSLNASLREQIAGLEGRSNYECSQGTPPYILKADGTFE